MNKTPTLRKQIGLEIFRKIRHNNAKLHELNTLFWECTLRCNLSCLHCGSDCHVQSDKKDMPYEDFMRVIEEITPHVNPHKTMIILPVVKLYSEKIWKFAEKNCMTEAIPGVWFPME